VRKSTECPASTARTPRAIARCVLPTPGGPSRTTFSARSGQPGELPHLLTVDRGLEVEVELVQRLDPGQAGELEAALDAALVTAAPLGFERLGEKAL
jgi:hypothetical protein